MGQVAADVIYGEVLLTQRDDAIAEGVGLRRDLRAFNRSQEEIASGILAKLVNKDAEASWGVTEPASGLGTGNPFDEKGAEGFVLAVRGIGGFEKGAGEVC